MFFKVTKKLAQKQGFQSLPRIFHFLEPWHHLSLILNFFKEVCAGADPVAVVAVHCLVDDGFFPRGLDGGEGHEAVEFSVAEVAVVFVHMFFWADIMFWAAIVNKQRY